MEQLKEADADSVSGVAALNADDRWFDVLSAEAHNAGAKVMSFGAATKTQGYIMTHGASANGGGTNFSSGNTIPIISVAAGAARASQITRGSETIVANPGGGSTTTKTPDSNRDYSLLAEALGGLNGAMLGFYKGDWAAVLQAVRTSTNSNVLATPHITTMDNQEAFFLVGQEVPVITGSTTGSNNTNPFQQVKRQEVGIKLKVTPQINEGDAVQLTIEQEVSSIGGATAVDITINKREIKTTVMADDGATVVLGGLIDEDVQESESKVP